MAFGIFNPQTGGVQQQGDMQQPLVRALMGGEPTTGQFMPMGQVGASTGAPGTLPVIPPLTTTPGVTGTPTPTPAPTGPSTLTNRDMIRAIYGDPTTHGGTTNDFLRQMMGRRGEVVGQGWGGTVDDEWNRDSDFWKNFETHMGRLKTEPYDPGRA